MPISTTSKILLAGGFTKRGSNFRISEGVLLWTAESRFSTGGDGHKHHLKNISVGGFTLGGLNVRIYRRTFSFGNLIFRNPGGEGLQIGPWMSELVKSSFFASQLNSRYRDGYDRHDTVKGTRESVNTSVRTTDRSNIGSTALKKNKRW